MVRSQPITSLKAAESPAVTQRCETSQVVMRSATTAGRDAKLPFFRLGQKFAQPLEFPLPAGAPVRKPLLGRRHPCRLDAAGAHSPDFRRAHQPAVFEHLQMLHYRCERDDQRLRQLRDRDRPLAQPFHNRPARWVAERVKDAMDVGFVAGHGSCLHQLASSWASRSSNSRHPSSRIFGPSECSKNAACSVKISFVLPASGTSSNVAKDAEKRWSAMVMV